MTQFYQVINFQHQQVKVFKTLSEARQHVNSLRETFPDEGFYIIELQVAYWIGDIR